MHYAEAEGIGVLAISIARLRFGIDAPCIMRSPTLNRYERGNLSTFWMSQRLNS
jgi:hypothetical protein